MTAGVAGTLIPGVPLLLGLLGLLLKPGDDEEHDSTRWIAATLGIAGAATALIVTALQLLFATKPIDLERHWVNFGGIEITLGFSAGVAALYITAAVATVALFVQIYSVA